MSPATQTKDKTNVTPFPDAIQEASQSFDCSSSKGALSLGPVVVKADCPSTSVPRCPARALLLARLAVFTSSCWEKMMQFYWLCGLFRVLLFTYWQAYRHRFINYPKRGLFFAETVGDEEGIRATRAYTCLRLCMRPCRTVEWTGLCWRTPLLTVPGPRKRT